MKFPSNLLQERAHVTGNLHFDAVGISAVEKSVLSCGYGSVARNSFVMSARVSIPSDSGVTQKQNVVTFRQYTT